MKIARKVTVLLTIIALCTILLPSGVFAAQLSEPEVGVVELCNAQRAYNSLPPLAIDLDLTEAADIRAAELVQVFSHDRPDGSSCFTVSSKAHGENIAYGYSTAEAVFEGWMNSQGHRENILNSSDRSIGVGCYVSDGKYYWVMLFGNGEAQNPTNPVTIKSNPAVGGKPTAFPESAMLGDSVVLNANPNRGYTFGGWVLNGSNEVLSLEETLSSFLILSPDVMIMATYIVDESVSNISNDKPSSSYTHRTITDPAGSVTVSGNMTHDAQIIIRDHEQNAEDTCTDCATVYAKFTVNEILLLRHIAINGSYIGPLELELHVGSEYNGQTVDIQHCKNDVLVNVPVTVTDGVAKGTFDSLSSFAVVQTEKISDAETYVASGVSQNIGIGRTGFWLVILGGAAILGFVVFKIIRRFLI